jgi:hypothetical protein
VRVGIAPGEDMGLKFALYVRALALYLLIFGEREPVKVGSKVS